MNKELLKMMEDFINGNYDPMDFSFDFPDKLLDCNDEKSLKILDDMPEYCSYYEPDEQERKKDNEFLGDEEFKNKVKNVYEKLKAYVEK